MKVCNGNVSIVHKKTLTSGLDFRTLETCFECTYILAREVAYDEFLIEIQMIVLVNKEAYMWGGITIVIMLLAVPVFEREARDKYFVISESHCYE